MSVGGQSSKSTQTPVDMTPDAFKQLQGPLAGKLAGLLGFKTTTVPTGGIGGTATKTAGAGTGIDYTSPYIRKQVGVEMGGNPNSGQGYSQQMRWVPNPNYGKQPMTGQGGSTTLIGSGSGDPLSGIPQYKGPLTVPTSANENQLLDLIQGKATGRDVSSAQSYLESLIGTSLKDYAGQLQDPAFKGIYDPNGNPFLQAAIEAAQRPTLEGLTETLTRDLPGRFTQNGQFIQPQSSSAFDRAAAIATRGAANANADIATNMSYSNFNDAANRFGGALGDFQGRQLDASKSLPGVTGQEIDNLVKSLQAEGLPRLIKDQGIDRGMALFKDRVDSLMKVLGITAGVTQPTISSESKSKSSGFNFGLGK